MTIRISTILMLLVAFLLGASTVNAQSVEFSSTLNPVGSGARATGMGGAFIAVADDATAASWNPAGLIQLEKPELSIVGSRFEREQSYDSLSHPEIDTTNTMSATGLNFASYVYPFQALGRNMVASISYQREYEMNKSINFKFNRNMVDPADYVQDSIVFSQEGFLYALSPAMAVQITPSLSLGLTYNIWNDYAGKNGWQKTYHSTAEGQLFGFPYYETLDSHSEISVEGTNMNIGFLFNATSALSVGGVVKTAFKADVTQTESSTFHYDALIGTLFPQNVTENTSDTTNFVMQMPMSYGLGLQYRFSDALTCALDTYRTQWSRFLFRDSSGFETNPLTGGPIGDGRLNDTTQVRFGSEYLFIGNNRTIALRGGLFSDQDPGRRKVDRYHGFSLGTGYSTAQYAVDASYQRRMGKDVTGDLSSVQDNKTDVTQDTYMVSLIFYY
jgi:long-subunit fatty acid transport protein